MRDRGRREFEFGRREGWRCEIVAGLVVAEEVVKKWEREAETTARLGITDLTA